MCDRVCFCFSEAPLTRDELDKVRRGAAFARYNEYSNTFNVTMCDTPCSVDWRTTACCCVGANPLTHSCVQLHMRYQVLNHVAPGSEWSNYECCQGYIPACPPCFEPGRCGERDCPRSCMFLEAFCFPGLAISASRFVLMEQYHLRPDPCDNRMIRINNCLQLLSIICDIAAHFDRNLRDLAQLIDCAADLIFLAISGCMTAQMDHEMAYRTALEAGRPDTYASVATSEPAGPAGVVEGKIVTPLQVETMDR